MTRCLGNREHPFVGELLLFHSQVWGGFLLPFVPAVLFAKDRQIPPTCLLPVQELMVCITD